MFFFLYLLAVTQSWAILGAYIPKAEHISQACKITAEKLVEQKRPVDPKTGKLIGKWEDDKEKEVKTDYFYCSGTLVGSNEIASASHCSQLIINKNVHYAEPGWARRTIMPGKIYATCGISTGKPETRELKWENSWPHPRYRDNDPARATIDTGIYRTDEAFSFAPMPRAKSHAETLALLRNTKSCRAFGFGIDNHGNAGELNGVRIYQFNNVSDYIIVSQTHFNSTMFGDSGGTLTCKDPKGNDVLVGSIQGGHPIDPASWMGTKRDFAFTSMSYGPVRRWHQFVASRPLSNQHCGEKPCAKKYPVLSEYVAKFDAVDEINGLVEELKTAVAIYKPHYPKSYFAGYQSLFKQVKAAHEDILGEYTAWKNMSPVIHGKTLYTRQKIVRGRPTDLKEVVLAQPFSYSYTSYPRTDFADFTRMRAYILMKFLEEELFALRHQGLSVGKKERMILDHAREHYWEFQEKEIEKYLKSFQ